MGEKIYPDGKIITKMVVESSSGGKGKLYPDESYESSKLRYSETMNHRLTDGGEV